jgi:hypothetical protein
MASLLDMIGQVSSPQNTAIGSTPDSLKSMFAPLMESMIRDATVRNDPISRLGDVGLAALDASGGGTPFAKSLAPLDAARQQATGGAMNMFLNVMGLDKQLEEMKAQERRFLATNEIDRARLELTRTQSEKESWTVEKVGETREGTPIYARVSKSGKVEPVIPTATSGPQIRTRTPHAEIEYAPGSAPGDRAANEVAAILDQSKRGPQFVGRTPGAVPTVPFELGPETPPQVGAEPAKEGEPPYRIWKGKPVLTPAQVEVDKKFGKEYAELMGSGGIADIQKNLAQLKSVSDRLKAGESLTGPIFGSLPRGVQRLTYPKETQALELVEEVVQRNLRLILGAQFTQKEGFRLIERAYNPALDPKYNAERLGRLVLAMERAVDAKTKAAAYFEKHGTLAGYRGPITPSISEIESAIDKPGAPTKDTWNKTPGGTRYRVVQ